MTAIAIEWLPEGQICVINLPSSVDIADLQTLDRELIQHLDTASGKVHLIADLRHLKHLPGVRTVTSVSYPYHKNMGHNLTIGLSSNPIVRFVITTGTQLIGLHHKDFTTLQEARAYLLQMEGL